MEPITLTEERLCLHMSNLFSFPVHCSCTQWCDLLLQIHVLDSLALKTLTENSLVQPGSVRIGSYPSLLLLLLLKDLL